MNRSYPIPPQQFSYLCSLLQQLTVQKQTIDKQKVLYNEAQAATAANIAALLKKIKTLSLPQHNRSINLDSNLLGMPLQIQRQVVFYAEELIRLQEVNKALTVKSNNVSRALLRVRRAIQQMKQRHKRSTQNGAVATITPMTTTPLSQRTRIPYRPTCNGKASPSGAPILSGASILSGNTTHRSTPRQAKKGQPVLSELFRRVREIANASTIKEATQIAALHKSILCLSGALAPTNIHSERFKYLALGLWNTKRRFTITQEDFSRRYKIKRREFIELTNKLKLVNDTEARRTLNIKIQRIKFVFFKLLLGKDRLDLLPREEHLEKKFINTIIYNEIKNEKEKRAHRSTKRKVGEITPE